MAAICELEKVLHHQLSELNIDPGFLASRSERIHFCCLHPQSMVFYYLKFYLFYYCISLSCLIYHFRVNNRKISVKRHQMEKYDLYVDNNQEIF